MKKSKQDLPAPKETSIETEGEQTIMDTSIETEKNQQDLPEDQEMTLEEKFDQVCLELEEQKKETLRILADSENFKKRLIKEKEDFCRFATSALIESILPVMDNLELALQHGKEEKECRNLIQGIEMTMNIFKDTLGKHGLTVIGSKDIGKPFNPAVHEAMAQVENETMDEGCVSQLIQTGYKLHDRLLRPAKVIVSRKATPNDN